MFGFSLWTWAQTIVYQARERADGIVIGHLLGATQVGVFSIGLELGSLPTTEFVEPLGRALFSGFASLNNASMKLENMFLSAVGLGLVLILPAGVGISMVADPMVRLSLGEHWLTAVPLVQIIAIGGTAAIFIQSCANLLNAIGRPSDTLYVGVASTAVKCIVLVLLVPKLALLGSAFAFLAASAVDLVGLLWLTLPRIGVSLSELAVRVLRPIVATIIMVVVLRHLGMAWTPGVGEDVWNLGEDAVIRSLTGAISYGAALVALWAAAGRPDGAERLAATMVKKMWGRVRHLT
jgi:O-antigen/teichoic acid export membrane protein